MALDKSSSYVVMSLQEPGRRGSKSDAVLEEEATGTASPVQLSEYAKQLMIEAVADPYGIVYKAIRGKVTSSFLLTEEIL